MGDGAAVTGAAGDARQNRIRDAACATAAAACLLGASAGPAAAAVRPPGLLQHRQVLSHTVATTRTAGAVRQQQVIGAPAAQHSVSRGSGAWQLANPVAQLAGLFGGSDLDEPVDPFTLYGTAFKRFFIDKLDGEKVMMRPDQLGLAFQIGAYPVHCAAPHCCFRRAVDREGVNEECSCGHPS
jgi:hypothetical protein